MDKADIFEMYVDRLLDAADKAEPPAERMARKLGVSDGNEANDIAIDAFAALAEAIDANQIDPSDEFAVCEVVVIHMFERGSNSLRPSRGRRNDAQTRHFYRSIMTMLGYYRLLGRDMGHLIE
jgi:hypothetical protein